MAWYEMQGGGIPASLKNEMDNVLNKKWGTSTTYPAATWPDTVNLMGPLPEKTVSGSVVVFSDGADTVPLKKCEITLPASLDGYSEVDVVSAGKNLLNDSIRGVRGGNIYFAHDTGIPQDFAVRLRAGTYTFSVVTADGTPSNLYLKNSDTDTFITGFPAYSSLSKTFTLSEDTNCAVFVYKQGYTDVTDILTAQIEAGSTATTYEPYTAPTTHTASLGRTIYGGMPDVVNGQGTETHKEYTASDVTSLYWNAKKAEQVDTNHRASFRIAFPSGYITINNSLCYGLSYSTNIASGSGAYEGYQLIATAGIYFCIDLSDIGMENATSSTPDEDFLNAIHNYGDNLKFVVELATPETFTFDPISINSKYGNNTIWSQEGNSEVTYRADINLALGQ